MGLGSIPRFLPFITRQTQSKKTTATRFRHAACKRDWPFSRKIHAAMLDLASLRHNASLRKRTANLRTHSGRSCDSMSRSLSKLKANELVFGQRACGEDADEQGCAAR